MHNLQENYFAKNKLLRKKKLNKHNQKYNIFFFLLIICHSYETIKNDMNIKKLKYREPFIISTKTKGNKITELIILLNSSLFISLNQSFY